jgi:hypothetical protein
MPDMFLKTTNSSKRKNKVRNLVGGLLNLSGPDSKYKFEPSMDSSTNLDVLGDSWGDVVAPLRGANIAQFPGTNVGQTLDSASFHSVVPPLRGSNVGQTLDSASFHSPSKKNEFDMDHFSQSSPQLKFGITFQVGFGDSKKKSSPTSSQPLSLSQPSRSFRLDTSSPRRAQARISDNVGVLSVAKEEQQPRYSRSKKSKPLSTTIIPSHESPVLNREESGFCQQQLSTQASQIPIQTIRHDRQNSALGTRISIGKDTQELPTANPGLPSLDIYSEAPILFLQDCPSPSAANREFLQKGKLFLAPTRNAYTS